MNKNTIIALILAIFLLICMPIASFAENPKNSEKTGDSEEIPSVEELIELINVAIERKSLFGGGGVLALFQMRPDDPELKWAKEEGLMPDTLISKRMTELYGINRHTGELIPYDPTIEYMAGGFACALPETVTLSDLKEICCRYFTADFCGIFVCPNHFRHDEEHCFYPNILTDENGRLYTIAREWMDEYFGDLLWNVTWEEFFQSAEIEITNQTADTIELTFYTPNPPLSPIPDTVDFRKTADGWRISGGSFMGFTDLMRELPPETGDRTPALLTASLLSLAALTAMAVSFSRKRKKEF